MKERVLQEEEEELIGGEGEAVEAGFQPDGLIAGILFLVKVIFPLNFGREAATQRVAQQHNSRQAGLLKITTRAFARPRYETLLKVGELVPTTYRLGLFLQMEQSLAVSGPGVWLRSSYNSRLESNLKETSG